MTVANTRKKQPELVRHALLECAGRIAAKQGMAALTVQAVAAAAGVTKGGLFHHFPSKQALVEAMFDHLLDRLDADIDAVLDADENARGRFTRAYVDMSFAHPYRSDGSPWVALSMAMAADPALALRWAQWLRRRLERHKTTDIDPTLEVIRLAADGVWLAFMTRTEHLILGDLNALRERLVAMTQP